MSDIVWEDPPPSTQGGAGTGRLQVILAELQKHPGKWAVTHEAARSKMAKDGLQKRGCETTTRQNGDGTYRVYARWPEESA